MQPSSSPFLYWFLGSAFINSRNSIDFAQKPFFSAHHFCFSILLPNELRCRHLKVEHPQARQTTLFPYPFADYLHNPFPCFWICNTTANTRIPSLSVPGKVRMVSYIVQSIEDDNELKHKSMNCQPIIAIRKAEDLSPAFSKNFLIASPANFDSGKEISVMHFDTSLNW